MSPSNRIVTGVLPSQGGGWTTSPSHEPYPTSLPKYRLNLQQLSVQNEEDREWKQETKLLREQGGRRGKEGNWPVKVS